MFDREQRAASVAGSGWKTTSKRPNSGNSFGIGFEGTLPTHALVFEFIRRDLPLPVVLGAGFNPKTIGILGGSVVL